MFFLFAYFTLKLIVFFASGYWYVIMHSPPISVSYFGSDIDFLLSSGDLQFILPQMLYSHNTTIRIYRCREIRNTDDSPLFKYETFIYFLTLLFRHEERETQFLQCWLFLHRPQSTPPGGLARPRVKSPLTAFFKNPQILSPSLPGMTSFTPQSIAHLGFLLWHLWLSYPLCASVNCTQCVHLH